MTQTVKPPDRNAFLIIGLLGIPMLAIAVGALVLPPGISFSLVRRGLLEGSWSWVVLGGLIGLMWIGMLYATGKKLFGRTAAPLPDEGDEA